MDDIPEYFFYKFLDVIGLDTGILFILIIGHEWTIYWYYYRYWYYLIELVKGTDTIRVPTLLDTDTNM